MAGDFHHQWLSDVFDAVNELYPMELATAINKVACKMNLPIQTGDDEE